MTNHCFVHKNAMLHFNLGCQSSLFSVFPGQLSYSEADGDGNPKLWCALSGGRVMVFDAASWSMQQNCIQVGSSQLVR